MRDLSDQSTTPRGLLIVDLIRQDRTPLKLGRISGGRADVHTPVRSILGHQDILV